MDYLLKIIHTDNNNKILNINNYLEIWESISNLSEKTKEYSNTIGILIKTFFKNNIFKVKIISL